MEAPPQTVPQILEPAGHPTIPYRLLSGPGAYVPNTPWSPWGGTGASVAIFLGAVLAVGLAVVIAQLNGRGMDDVMVQIVITLIQQIAMIALTLFAASRYGGTLHEVLALRAPAQGPKAYAAALVLLLLGTIAITLIIRFAGVAIDKNDIKLFEGMFKSEWWWLALILVGIGAPLSEELLCRGFLFSALAKSRLGILGASIVTSLIFAVVHPYSVVAVLQVFIIGMMFSWMLVRTGSLRVPILCHSVFNTLQGLVLLYASSNP